MPKPTYDDTRTAISLMALCLQDVLDHLSNESQEYNTEYMCAYIKATLGQKNKLLNMTGEY